MNSKTTDGLRFVHLHLHSEYSLLDGGNVIERLVARVKELGMNAVALTDHGNLFGAIEFYSAAKAAGIKPILGIEAYVAPGDRTERKTTGIADGGFHLVLLAETLAGWRHLIKLSSDSYLNGFYYKPRMDKSTLERWSDGLIAINGHLGSSLAHHLVQYAQTSDESHYQAALQEARWHAATFGPNERGEGRFFIELQRHDTPEQERINPLLIRLARELDLPLVCDNDAHFLLAEDWDVHDSLCCISMNRTKDDAGRLHYSRQLYVKSPQQMAEQFADVPEAVANAGAIADRCNVELSFDQSHAPMVRVVRADGVAGGAGDAGGADPGLRPESTPGSSEWFGSICSKYTLLPYDAHSADAIDPARIKKECDQALRELCESGLVWRYGESGITERIRTRLDWELKVLADKLISAYFLIVWDFVSWARQRGIPAAARGSGVGTMVGYVLGLSNSCPERYGLLFERFTDPDRAEYPDIDVDICQDGRAEVIEYVRQKYGHVAQIITFGRLKAKAAIKDVARVMGLPPAEGQRLSNLVPHELNITIDEALEKEPNFRAECESNPVVKKVVEVARALEDHARHAGVHAAGVVIATQPLDTIVPLCKTPGNEDVVTQWDGPTCEKLGLLKMDFLGLRTLSTIELAKKLIRQTLSEEAIWAAVGGRDLPPLPEGEGRGEGSAGPQRRSATPSPLTPLPRGEGDALDLDRLQFDDQRVLDLFRRGDTSGVFQFESDGMRRLLMEMQPDRLEDLIAANALFRPGPMELMSDYCMRKHRRQAVPRIHPIVDQFTAETYGIMVYQEQVMQIVHGLGGVPLRSAYSLIKAISKKKSSVIDAERPKFIDGAERQGLPRTQAAELFDLVLKFAGYGFNKSHSTGYAIIAYQTAYLKTYFPNQYMAAVLTYESAGRKVDEWVSYLEDCKRTIFPDHGGGGGGRHHVGVEVRPPDINLSDERFTVVFMGDEPRDACHGHVRFGLGAIKGLGSAAIRAIIDERKMGGPYDSIFDFCERVDLRSASKSSIELLVKCGAFDSLHGASGRAAVLEAVAGAFAAGQRAAEDRLSGQLNIFQTLMPQTASAPAAPQRLPTVAPWDQMTMLKAEHETLGFHVSGHPLDQFDAVLAELGAVSVAAAAELRDEAALRLGAIVTRVRPTFVRQGAAAGQRMAMITVQDKTGSIDGVVFSAAFAEFGHLLRDRAIVLLIGRLDRKRGDPNVIVEKIMPIEDASLRLAGRIELDITDGAEDAAQQTLQMLAGLLARAASIGPAAGSRSAEVHVRVRAGDRRVTLRSRTMRAVPDPHLLHELRRLLGDDHVRLVASALDTAPPPRSRNFNGARRREAAAV